MLGGVNVRGTWRGWIDASEVPFLRMITELGGVDLERIEIMRGLLEMESL